MNGTTYSLHRSEAGHLFVARDYAVIGQRTKEDCRVSPDFKHDQAALAEYRRLVDAETPARLNRQ